MNEFKKNNRYLLVFNSEAGKGSSLNKKELIVKYFIQKKCRFKIINTDRLSQVENFDKYKAVVVIGGDGTVLKAIPYVINTNIKLGIIPCGTANLFAASLSIPFNIKKAIDIIINDSTSKVDIGKVGTDYFALRVGMGYDADVVNGATRLLKQKIGYLAYFIQGMIYSFKLSTKSYTVTIDNKTFEIDANAIIISNTGNMFRNLCTIAPLGSITDGKLDIFILRAKNIWEFLTVFARIIFNKHKQSAKSFYSQAKNIKIHSIDKNMHIDGERVAEEDIDISIIPKALTVVIP
ncbi:MAG: diacylglycerol kinase family protein [bacterium]